MKKQNIEKLLSTALKKELAAFPKPSRQLRSRLSLTAPMRVRKIVWTAAIGFVSTAIVLFFLCVEQHHKPEIVDNYFKPTKTVDLNELSFEPTKTIDLGN